MQVFWSEFTHSLESSVKGGSVGRLLMQRFGPGLVAVQGVRPGWRHTRSTANRDMPCTDMVLDVSLWAWDVDPKELLRFRLSRKYDVSRGHSADCSGYAAFFSF